jgi:hypothetical protein
MTRPAAARNGTGPACLGAPDFTSPWLPKYGPAVPAGMAGAAIGAPLPLGGHHHDGAVRVMRDLVADRTVIPDIICLLLAGPPLPDSPELFF